MASAVTSGMLCVVRSIFLATLLASSLIGCGGQVSDSCDSCAAMQHPRSSPENGLSSTDATALMRAKVPPSAKLMSLDNDPHEWLAHDGTSPSWFCTFEDDDTQQAWFGRISALSGVATVSLEPKLYLHCPGPGFSASGWRDDSTIVSYSEAAPCVVANVAGTVGALLTGHYVSATQFESGGNFDAWYDDDGQSSALCGPCKSGPPSACTSCTR